MKLKRLNKAIDRGRVESILLNTPIVLNANTITKAKIEIDHINYGLNTKTGTLNIKKRTDFSIRDIEKFLLLLDGEYLSPAEHRKRISRFEVRIDSPISNKFYGKEFLMIFETDYDKPDEIHTITLIPGW
jgi:hypothetical protein